MINKKIREEKKIPTPRKAGSARYSISSLQFELRTLQKKRKKARRKHQS
jgi:hypothetical protein